MKKTGIVLLLFFLFTSLCLPVQAKELRITLQRDFAPEYITGTETPLFADVELEKPVRRGPSAESFVSTLAHDERKERMIAGGILTGMGLLFIVGGTDTDDDSSSPIIGGLVLTGLGLYSLIVPGYIESQYNRLMKIEDPQEREEAAYTVLMHIADKAKIERISNAIVSAALSFYCFTAHSDYEYTRNYYNYYGFLFGGLSVYYFLVESPAERMLKEYKEGQKQNGSFAIIPRPDGSIAAVYSLAF